MFSGDGDGYFLAYEDFRGKSDHSVLALFLFFVVVFFLCFFFLGGVEISLRTLISAFLGHYRISPLWFSELR